MEGAMQNVLVAGSSGYVGRYAAQAFKEKGCFVRALVREPEKLKHPGPFGEPALEGLVDEIVTGDATRPDILHGIADGIDTVFSSMGLRNSTPGRTYHDVDYLGNVNILQEALSRDVEKFVYVSILKADAMMDMQIVKGLHTILKPLNTRIADMLYFAIAVNEIDNAAPRYGSLRMKDFFKEFGKKYNPD